MAVAPFSDPAEELEALYRENARRVYRYALAVLRNPADAEDVTQTTFMNAYRAMQNGTEPQKPENWLIRIAHNACRTRFIRAANRPTEVPLDETVHDVAVPDDERPNLRELLRALGQLPFNQRSALVMRELEGRSYEEIAEVLGVTVAAVEMLVFRARRSLKVRRATMRSLGAVQLPASLQSVFGGGAAVTCGTLAGGGAVLKAAALLTAAVTATGAGFQAVKASSARRPAARPHAAHQVLAVESATGARSAAGGAKSVPLAAKAETAGRVEKGRSVPTRRRGAARTVATAPHATISSVPVADSPAAGAGGTVPAAGGAPAEPAQSPAPAEPAPHTSPVPVPVSAPALPAAPLPAAPAVPAAPPLPALPPVSVPVPPVAVPTPPPLPAVPDPPPLPLPKLP